MYRQKKTLAQLAFIFQKHEFLTKTVSWNMSEIIK